MGLINKLQNLDEKVLPSRFRGKILGAVATTLLGISGICGILGYNEWRNEYSYRETEHISAPNYLNVSEDSPANKALADFPIEIPGASRVDKYVTPGAKYCLVHIRQVHLTEDIPKEDLKKVQIVQGDIYNILTFLVKNNRLNEVYTEGLAIEFQDLPNSRFEIDKLLDLIHKNNGSSEKRIRDNISELENKVKSGKQSPIIALEAQNKYRNDKNCINKYISDLNQELFEQRKRLPDAIEKDNDDLEERKSRYQYNAVKKLGFNYGTKIIPSEIFGDNIKAAIAMEKIKKGDKNPNLNAMILDNREDIVLKFVAKNESPIVVCVYGGGHVWGGRKSFGRNYPLTGNEFKTRFSTKDNIFEWNKEHPNKKFSLIEVTPVNYTRSL